MSTLTYLLVKIDIEDSAEVDTSVHYLETNITFSLKTLFGDCGAGIPFSVLKFQNLTAVLSCPDQSLVKLRTALTLQGTYQGNSCCYTVLRVTKNLLCLN